MAIIMKNRKIILKSRPAGQVVQENFELTEEELGDPDKGDILVKSNYVSVDPYMRNRMNSFKSYVAPYKVGQVIEGDATGCVIRSNSDRFREGDIVHGSWGWQENAIVKENSLTRINPDMAPESAYLGVLGLTGLTAYFGLLEIGQPSVGETVVVSGAAGSTGSIVGQIARIQGCRVVGIAGSDQKCKLLEKKLGFDAAINYKSHPNVRKPLMKVCPDGVDIYFDNVGGDISDSVIYLINNFARIVLCGQISQYNQARMATGPRLQSLLLIHRVKMQGFIVFDYREKYDEAMARLADWLNSGLLTSQENIIRGFEQIPAAFIGLFEGENIGKQLVRI
jgi:NADPH-dependent curcumin reductase CurA